MSDRRPVFAANWKMNLNSEQAHNFVAELLPQIAGAPADILIFPPAVYLPQLVADTSGTPVGVGAQNLFWERSGAYTGEISVGMIHDIGARYVLCGHSERRHYFNESAEMVTRKARAAQSGGLVPVVCVGETLAEREAGETLETLHNDIVSSLSAVEPDPEIIVAYEPVWAIGTGRVAMPADAEEAIAYLRQQIGRLWGESIAAQVRILYGGSVQPDNIAELMACPNIDGGLIGGASLRASSFLGIIKNGFALTRI